MLCLLLAACGNADRDAKLDARIVELTSETERLSRELVDLRKTGVSPKPGTATNSADSLLQTKQELATTQASLAGLFDYLSTQTPDSNTELHLLGTWKSLGPDGKPAEVLHVLAGGKLCGWRRAPGGTGREPFWGRWERHGRFLAELHDHWMGDHNEIDPRVRFVDSADGTSLQLKDRSATKFALAPLVEWPALASHSDDRLERMSLPDWCLTSPVTAKPPSAP